MLNVKQLLDRVMSANQTGSEGAVSSATGGLFNNPMALGALAGGGGLLTALLSNNKNLSRIAGIGGAAALGAVAFKAFNNWQAKNGGAAAAAPQGQQAAALDFGALPAATQEEHSRAVLLAMIEAAKADGVFDEQERRRILEEMQKVSDTETTAWVQQQINKPLDVDAVARLATSPEMAAEIYLASLLIIDEQNAAEKNYLDLLAYKMNLPPQLREEIEKAALAGG